MSETSWLVRVERHGDRTLAVGRNNGSHSFQFDIRGDESDYGSAKFMAAYFRRKGKQRFYAAPDDQETLAVVIEAMNEPYSPWLSEDDGELK